MYRRFTFFGASMCLALLVLGVAYGFKSGLYAAMWANPYYRGGFTFSMALVVAMVVAMVIFSIQIAVRRWK